MSIFTENESWRNDSYIPPEKRKTILLLSDDMRLPSGVGTMSKEIILKTIHHFNWVQVGGAIKHPDQGKIIIMNDEIKKMIPNMDNNSCKIYPVSGYGDPDLIRYLLNNENLDGIMHFTDPRFWIWLYQMEHEIRQEMPLLFYTIWDDLPYPMYNQYYYESCDSIAGISKQTVNIVRNVRANNPLRPELLQYIPHGIDRDVFYPIDEGTDEHKDMLEFKKKVFDGKDVDFIVFYNNRNIRRKMPGDVVLAFKTFVDMLPEDARDKTALLMHTAPVDNNGTDLIAVKNAIAPNCNIFFSNQRLEPKHMNFLYNISSITVNIASNEGFGLSSAESIMAGTPVVNNVTGGLQDQVGLKDEKGEYLDVNKHYCAEWGSNHDAKYKDHGSWAKPVFPTNRALVGSPPTPYIFDDRCQFDDVAEAFKYWYDIPKEDRDKVGKEGREWQHRDDVAMTAQKMGMNFIEYIDQTLELWEPRKRFTIYQGV